MTEGAFRSWLEFGPGHSRLTNDGLKCADPQFRVVRNGYGACRTRKLLLHHDMTSAPARLEKPVANENGADLFPGKNTEPSQQQLPRGSRKPP